MATRTKTARRAQAMALAEQLLERDPEMFDALLCLMGRLSTSTKETSITLTKEVDAEA